MSSYRHPIAPQENPQVRTISNSSAQSSAVAATTEEVRLCSDTDCFIAIGSNPTATTSSVYLPAKFPQVFGCKPADKVAVIGTSGNLYISEANAVF